MRETKPAIPSKIDVIAIIPRTRTHRCSQHGRNAQRFDKVSLRARGALNSAGQPSSTWRGQRKFEPQLPIQPIAGGRPGASPFGENLIVVKLYICTWP